MFPSISLRQLNQEKVVKGHLVAVPAEDEHEAELVNV